MGLKKLIAGLGMIACLAGCHDIKPSAKISSTMGNNPQVVTTIDHYVQEHGTDLKCKDVARITRKGFGIYACESDLTPELIQNFEYVADVKDFGHKKIKLVKSESYKVFKNSKTEEAITWHWLFISKKFVVPKKWKKELVKENKLHRIVVRDFLILRSKVDKLEDDKEYYKRRGYDVYLRQVKNFSNSCNLSPKFLERTPWHQADTILHEELHATVDDKKWESNLEESVANLIGMVGSMEFCKERFGEKSFEYESAKKALETEFTQAKAIVKANKELKELFASDSSREKKIKKKEEILDELKKHIYITNNASLYDTNAYKKNFVLMYQIYLKHPKFKDLVNILKNMPKEEAAGIEYLKRFAH